MTSSNPSNQSNPLSESQKETLVIFLEECAECIQEASKIIRFGLEEDNKDALEKELADLLCMVFLLSEQGIISPWSDNIDQQIMKKAEKLKRWSSNIPKEMLDDLINKMILTEEEKSNS